MKKVQTGMVIEFYSNSCLVRFNNKNFNCKIKKKLPVVVGDRVGLVQENNELFVISINDRFSELCWFKAGEKKPLASNLSHLGILIAESPKTNSEFIDKWIVLSNYSNIQPFIIFNKIDLSRSSESKEIINLYKGLGIKLLKVSAKLNDRVDEINAYLNNKTTILVGQSGVGKSTLTTVLTGHTIKIQPLSKNHGQHTTSSSKMYAVQKNNGMIIDSPGIRDIDIVHIPKSFLLEVFSEIGFASKSCQFKNCNHQYESGCAVLEKLNNGTISKSRYNNFLKFNSIIKNE
tara:strand:+ start:35794 stop:36660 length:867 start_codon:yes stop_codon:yes gene_type:complete